MTGTGLKKRARAVLMVAAAMVAAGCSEVESDLPDVPTSSAAPADSTSTSAPSGEEASATPEETTTTTTSTTTTEPPATWTLLAGGDVLMTRTEPAGIDPFAAISPSLASGDLALVNVEMAISERGHPYDKEFVFRAPPSAAARIAAAGVDVANLGNNHAKDYGSVALRDTITLLEAEGVVALGAGSNDAEAYRMRILEVDGVRVAFVGASLVVPVDFEAGPAKAGVASVHRPTRPRVLETVSRAAEAADVVIATVHWGIERTTCPNDAQRTLARELLDAGADAVIGHHPHVLQPVEFADGELVAYSLGNFIWHARTGLTGETGVLQIDFERDQIVGFEFHPHVLDANGAPVPVASGTRYVRIRDIVAGACAGHQPPAVTTTSTTSTTTTTTTTTLPPPIGTAGIA